MELNYIQERAEEEDSIFTESLTGQQTKRDQLTQKDSQIGYQNQEIRKSCALVRKQTALLTGRLTSKQLLSRKATMLTEMKHEVGEIII